MQYTNFIGIDVSKETLDICVMADHSVLVEFKISNDKKSLKTILSRTKKLDIHPFNTLWCMENTGIYNNLLLYQLVEKNHHAWVENPTQIKRSQGIQRGKNDKVDARRIATYAKKNQAEVRLASIKNTSLLVLKNLCNTRASLVSSKSGLEVPIKEAKRFLPKEVARATESACKATLKAIAADIKQIEKQMLDVINEDAELRELFGFIISVEGVGLHTASAILIYTNGFKDINCPKKFACYSGVVPFDHQSGTSLRFKPRVSKMANKDMKRLLHMAVLTTLKLKKSEFNAYYQRKIAEGKNPMTVLNAMRNKLIHRVFSCVRNRKYYEKRNIVAPIDQTICH